MCRARAANSFRQSLHRAGNGRRPDRGLNAAKHRVFSRDDEVACQRKFKGATKRCASNSSDRRNLQGLYGAERLVAFGNEGPELIGILLQEVENIAPLAEIGTFGSHQQRPDVALAGFVDGLLQRIREVRGDEVLRRVVQYDMTDCVLLFEFDDSHFQSPFMNTESNGQAAATGARPASLRRNCQDTTNRLTPPIIASAPPALDKAWPRASCPPPNTCSPSSAISVGATAEPVMPTQAKCTPVIFPIAAPGDRWTIVEVPIVKRLAANRLNNASKAHVTGSDGLSGTITAGMKMAAQITAPSTGTAGKPNRLCVMSTRKPAMNWLAVLRNNTISPKIRPISPAGIFHVRPRNAGTHEEKLTDSMMVAAF